MTIADKCQGNLMIELDWGEHKDNKALTTGFSSTWETGEGRSCFGFGKRTGRPTRAGCVNDKEPMIVSQLNAELPKIKFEKGDSVNFAVGAGSREDPKGKLDENRNCTDARPNHVGFPTLEEKNAIQGSVQGGKNSDSCSHRPTGRGHESLEDTLSAYPGEDRSFDNLATSTMHERFMELKRQLSSSKNSITKKDRLRFLGSCLELAGRMTSSTKKHVEASIYPDLSCHESFNRSWGDIAFVFEESASELDEKDEEDKSIWWDDGDNNDEDFFSISRSDEADDEKGDSHTVLEEKESSFHGKAEGNIHNFSDTGISVDNTTVQFDPSKIHSDEDPFSKPLSVKISNKARRDSIMPDPSKDLEAEIISTMPSPLTTDWHGQAISLPQASISSTPTVGQNTQHCWSLQTKKSHEKEKQSLGNASEWAQEETAVPRSFQKSESILSLEDAMSVPLTPKATERQSLQERFTADIAICQTMFSSARKVQGDAAVECRNTRMKGSSITPGAQASILPTQQEMEKLSSYLELEHRQNRRYDPSRLAPSQTVPNTIQLPNERYNMAATPPSRTSGARQTYLPQPTSLPLQAPAPCTVPTTTSRAHPSLQTPYKGQLNYTSCSLQHSDTVSSGERPVQDQLSCLTEAQFLCIQYAMGQWDRSSFRNIDLTDEVFLRFARNCPGRKKFHDKSTWRLLKNFDQRYFHLGVHKMERQLLTKTLFPVPGLKSKDGHNMFYMRPSRFNPKVTRTEVIIDNLVYVMQSMLQSSEHSCTHGISFMANMDDWTMANFSLQYCQEFLMMLQGQGMPVQVKMFLIVNPPSWFASTWRIMKTMMTTSFRKKVRIIPDTKLDKLLAEDWRDFAPDDMLEGSASTEQIVEFFLKDRKKIEGQRAALGLRGIF